ncbi:hypothetical protein D9M70_567090 [compost metagenome]
MDIGQGGQVHGTGRAGLCLLPADGGQLDQRFAIQGDGDLGLVENGGLLHVESLGIALASRLLGQYPAIQRSGPRLNARARCCCSANCRPARLPWKPAFPTRATWPAACDASLAPRRVSWSEANRSTVLHRYDVHRGCAVLAPRLLANPLIRSNKAELRFPIRA